MDVERLDRDPQYRFDHLLDLLDFGPGDWVRLQRSADWLDGAWESLVRDVYGELMEYEPTGRFYRDEEGVFDPESLRHRVEGFVHWFRRMNEAEGPDELRTFLADVGRIHTAGKGFTETVVEEFYLGPCLTLLMNGVRRHLADHAENPRELHRLASAWQKFLELQRSFFRLAYHREGVE